MKLSKRQLFGLCLGAAVIVATYCGWKLFLFTTDDAYIAFRYVSNSMAGHGLTWNPPPFRPVEGYSSFLWVILLREVWHIFGVEPPQAANVLSLLFGYATLFLGYRFIVRMKLPEPLAGARWIFLVLVMVGTISNRTFLTWLSSGLETSFFNFLFTWWIYEGTASAQQRKGSWAVRLSFSATLTALARPDGMLLVLATPLILSAASAGPILGAHGVRSRTRELISSVRGAWPLLGIPLHMLWRRVTYGDWLPNTYYAKHVDPWPESGARYVASFIVEYGVAIWILLALLVLVLAVPSWRASATQWATEPSDDRRDALRRLIERSPPAITIGVVVAHFGYYTFNIGGDHFEYRVYSHLVLLLFVSTVWLLGQLASYLPSARPLRPRMAFGVLLLFIACAQPIPWTHWAQTHDLDGRRETFRLIERVAPSFPSPIRPLVAQWDHWQNWLISHSVCMRHQEHKVFGNSQRHLLPARGKAMLRLQSQGEPVIAFGLVGVLGWVLPDVAVIDTLGLNDHVVARNTALREAQDVPAEHGRQMAHDRKPPPGYVECFRPNFSLSLRSGIGAEPRTEPLTKADIVACEDRFWERSEPSKLAKAPAFDDTLAKQLNALGYVSGTTPAGPQKGVTVYKEALAQKGHNFFTSGHAPAAFLMDMEGKILHEWRADFDELWPNHPRAPKGGIGDQQNFWRHAQLLPNGDVLGIWQHYGIFKLNKDSKVLWAKPGLAHHDLAVADDGTIYHLSSEHKPMPELEGMRAVLDVIVIRDPNGEELRRLSIGKALQQANWPKLRDDFWERERTRKHGVAPGAKHDPFHTNSIWILSEEEASKLGSPFRAGNLLVSMCVLDTIATIDFERGTTTWWQVGPFALQHQPRVTHDGKIIVFNNHLTAQTSSVQIIDPHTGKLTWEYTGPESAPLASRTSSAVEVLANGNILITETNKGRILEITPKEEIVWEFHNPFNTRGARALIGHLYNIDRVDRSLLSWLPAIGSKEASGD